MNLSNPEELKNLIRKHGFSFSKSLGQNFLTDRKILDNIIKAAELDKSCSALEIGAGAGVLTRELAKNTAKTVAVELDRRLIPVLSDALGEFENAEIINGDILKLDLRGLISEKFAGMPVSVVANLPYYITTPIIIKLLENSDLLNSITVMVQKEVAERICAKPGGKEYGALSIAVQYKSAPEIICTAEPGCFTPPPKVASSVVMLKILPEPSVSVKDEKLFFNVVKSAFGQRRKTLSNALAGSPYFSLPKDEIVRTLGELGFNADIRGEKLSISDFASLVNKIYELR